MAEAEDVDALGGLWIQRQTQQQVQMVSMETQANYPKLLKLRFKCCHLTKIVASSFYDTVFCVILKNSSLKKDLRYYFKRLLIHIKIKPVI